MALVHIPQRRIWTRQPQQKVGVNWANPISRNLRFLWTPISPTIDLVSGLPFAQNGTPQPNIAKYGRSLFTSGALTGYGAADVTTGSPQNAQYNAVAPPMTLCALMQNDSAANNAASGISRGNGSGGQSWDVGLYKGSNSGASAHIRTTGATLDIVPGAFLFDTTARPILVTLSIGTTNTNLYSDDTLTQTAATPAGAFYYEYGDVYRCLAVGSQYKDAGQSMYIGFAAIWWRELSQAEHRSLSANPWQLLAPANDSIWLPSSAALFPTLSSPRMTGITTTGGVPTVNYTF